MGSLFCVNPDLPLDRPPSQPQRSRRRARFPATRGAALPTESLVFHGEGSSAPDGEPGLLRRGEQHSRRRAPVSCGEGSSAPDGEPGLLQRGEQRSRQRTRSPATGEQRSRRRARSPATRGAAIPTECPGLLRRGEQRSRRRARSPAMRGAALPTESPVSCGVRSFKLLLRKRAEASSPGAVGHPGFYRDPTFSRSLRPSVRGRHQTQLSTEERSGTVLGPCTAI
ncbi:hypothetical protein NDU88_004827 [Pleurodeles waltl]|uniref:Uncharacterized protein n=1 Tax=Pleurodeles waltl TaxID=8319 RepID=A0AAV7WX26_PLEWA|nr:hypothetical protein NDU88_004827 [Pleurodeles waltl]